jgi:multidrug efflux pump subunit AcrA (membrane-fusion protein)
VQSLRLPERSAAPATWRTFLPWVLCAALAGCVAFLSLREAPPGEGQAAAAVRAEGTADGQQLSASADGALAAVPAGEVVLKNKGNITPIHQIQVSPKVSGMVEKLTFKEGDKVQKGDVLAVLEKVEYQSDYDRATGAEASAQARLETLRRFRKQEADQAKAELDETVAQREQLLLDWKRSAGLRGSALSAKEYEQAESAYRAMDRRSARLRVAWLFLKDKGPRDEQIAAAEADVRSATADKAKAKWRLDNCVVTAPISGTILTKKTEEGSIVNAAAFNIAASLCDMANLAEMEVDLAIPERDIAKVMRPVRDESRKVWRRQKCQVVAEAYPDRPYDGYVSRIMPMADRGKGSVPVRVRIVISPREAGQYLRPDMGALVRFLNATVESKD